jgi:hypothetical protein
MVLLYVCENTKSMTIKEMTQFVKIDNPVTYNSVRVDFKNLRFEIGFFIGDDEDLNQQNKWRFVPNNLAAKYHKTKNTEDSIVINGDDVLSLTLL